MTRLNVRTRLVLSKCTLTPYRRAHVGTYHAWMADPELLRLTASEPLTLEEELANQKSWRDDPNKMTFIVHERAEPARPVGDVNVFVHVEDARRTGELEVMIAERSARGKGLAFEAVCALMLYAARVLRLDSFVAKVGFDNTASLALFAKLAFEHESSSQEFREQTLRATARSLDVARAELGRDEPREEEDVDAEVDELRKKGNAAFSRNDLAAAIAAYDAAIEIDERDAVLFSNRSQARLRSADPFGALFDAATAAALDPDFSKARHRVASAWAFLGDTARAREAHRQAAADFPEHAASFAALSTKLVEGADPSIAVTPNFLAARELAPAVLPLLVDLNVSAPDPRAARFGAVTALWRRLQSTEKHEIFMLFCSVMRVDADAYDVAPHLFETASARSIVVPGGVPESDLPPALAKMLRAAPEPTNGRSGRVALTELLFSALAFPERGVVGDALMSIVKPARMEA